MFFQTPDTLVHAGGVRIYLDRYNRTQCGRRIVEYVRPHDPGAIAGSNILYQGRFVAPQTPITCLACIGAA